MQVAPTQRKGVWEDNGLPIRCCVEIFPKSQGHSLNDRTRYLDQSNIQQNSLRRGFQSQRAGVGGIEPPQQESKSCALPLGYTPLFFNNFTKLCN